METVGRLSGGCVETVRKLFRGCVEAGLGAARSSTHLLPRQAQAAHLGHKPGVSAGSDASGGRPSAPRCWTTDARHGSRRFIAGKKKKKEKAVRRLAAPGFPSSPAFPLGGYRLAAKP